MWSTAWVNESVGMRKPRGQAEADATKIAVLIVVI